MKTVVCPTCHKTTQWSEQNKYRPFCCERCKQIDLGAWAKGQYVIAGNKEKEEADNPSEDKVSE